MRWPVSARRPLAPLPPSRQPGWSTVTSKRSRSASVAVSSKAAASAPAPPPSTSTRCLAAVRAQRHELPAQLVLGSRVVGAEGAGAHRAVEVAAERGVALLDAADRLADRARGVDAGALGRRGGDPVAPAEPHGRGELVGDRLALGLRRGRRARGR